MSNKLKSICSVKLSQQDLLLLLEILSFTKEAAYTIMLASDENIEKSTKARMKKVAEVASDLQTVFSHHVDMGEPESDYLN